MAFTYPNAKRIARCLLGMLVAGALAAPVSLAADNHAGSRTTLGTHTGIRNIRPIGEGSSVDANVRPEQVFDVVGSLNTIDGNRIVIGSRALSLASGVSANGIAKWTQVGAKLNQSGEVVVLEKISDEPH